MDKAQGPTGDFLSQNHRGTQTKPAKPPYGTVCPTGGAVAVGALSHLCDIYWLAMSELELTRLSVCVVQVRLTMCYHSLYRWLACSDPEKAV